MCGYFQAHFTEAEKQPAQWLKDLPPSSAKHPFEELDLEAAQELPEVLAAKAARGDFNPNQSHLLPIYDEWQANYAEVLSKVDGIWEAWDKTQGAHVKNPHFLRFWNARETLIHFRNFAGPKLHRALGGRFDAGGIIPSQSDWNGSAKALILALEEIETALNALGQSLVEPPRILNSWASLNRHFKTELDQTFPDAQKFRRPGFDEI